MPPFLNKSNGDKSANIERICTKFWTETDNEVLKQVLPSVRNSLPRSVHFCESLTTFRKHLKTFYFQFALPGAP